MGSSEIRGLARLWALLGCAAFGGACEEEEIPQAATHDAATLQSEDGATTERQTRPGSDAGTAVPRPSTVETVVPADLTAGRTFAVSCLLIDNRGMRHATPADTDVSVVFSDPEAVQAGNDGSYVARLAGDFEVTCSLPELGLTDESPAHLSIRPGRVAEIRTELDVSEIRAGNEVAISCFGQDRFGNVLADLDVDLLLVPHTDNARIDGYTLTVERAQDYEVFCDHAMASVSPAMLTVTPGLPSSVRAWVMPQGQVHAPGEQLRIATEVTDRFGNAVKDAEVELLIDAQDAVEKVDPDNLIFEREGRYRLTARVTGDTLDGAPVETVVDLVVDGTPPAIRCSYPEHGQMLEASSAGRLQFRGEVTDSAGIESVSVNGQAAGLLDGIFQAELDTRYGINLVEVVAEDRAGQQASQLCAFMVAPTYLPEGRITRHTVWLQLPAEAFDDMNRDDGLDSIADLLHAALASQKLRDQIHQELRQDPTLKPSACDESILGGCVLRSEVRYEDLRIMGAPSIGLGLVNDGLAAEATLRGVRLGLRVRGHVAGIDYDSRGTVTIRTLRASSEFDVSRTGTRLQATLRPGTVRTSVSGVDLDFSGADGAIIDIVGDLFNGAVRDLITDVVHDVVTEQLAEVLTSSLRGIDVASLRTRLTVDRPLETGAPVSVSTSLSLSAIETDRERMVVGFGTAVRSPLAHGRPARGIPARSQPRALKLNTRDTVLAIHEALANQVSFALWRAGWFEMEVRGDGLDNIPDDLKVHTTMGLPPVVELSDGRARVSVGAVDLLAESPRLLGPTAIRIRAGARLSARLGLNGQELRVSDFALDEIVFATDRPDTAPSATEEVRQSLKQLFAQALAPMLERALPGAAVPEVSLPDEAEQWGIPSGTSLQLLRPRLQVAPPALMLRGTLGTR